MRIFFKVKKKIIISIVLPKFLSKIYAEICEDKIKGSLVALIYGMGRERIREESLRCCLRGY